MEPAQSQHIRSVTPPPRTTHTNLHNKSRNRNSSELAALLLHHEEDKNSILKPATLAILKQEMSDLRYMYSKKKPKEGGWAYSIASKNIDNWQIITRSEEIDDLSVHQLMFFLQAHSYAQLDLHKYFLQKCNLNQFFEDIAPEKIKSDLNTIKKYLKLIQYAASDITKIAEQITILEDVSIVQCMIKVSDRTFSLSTRICCCCYCYCCGSAVDSSGAALGFRQQQSLRQEH